MSMLNRRNALTAVATLPTLAVPAAVAAMDSSDAELIRLGVTLDAIISEWQAQVRKDQYKMNVWRAACEAAGLPLLDLNKVSFEEFDARNKARNDLWYPEKAENDANDAAEHDENGDNIVWTDIHNRLYTTVDEILSRTAQTITGLAVQTRAVVMAAAEMWNENTWEDPHARLFIEAVCSFAGVSHKELLA
jgi:hypothetical protein